MPGKRQQEVRKEPDYSVVKLMQEDNPVAVYKKDIVGQVSVKYFDSLEGTFKERMLVGLPNDNKNENNFIELWSEAELIYFKRENKFHLENGYLVEFDVPRDRGIEQTVNNLSATELRDLVNAPFLKLKKTVEQMTSEAAVMRTLAMADEEERPAKTMEFLKERLSKIQLGE